MQRAEGEVRSQTKHAVAQPRFAGITSYRIESVTGRGGDTPSPKPHALYCTAHSFSSAISNKKTELELPTATVGLKQCPIFSIKWAF